MTHMCGRQTSGSRSYCQVTDETRTHFLTTERNSDTGAASRPDGGSPSGRFD
jgi:hypothetical protein